MAQESGYVLLMEGVTKCFLSGRQKRTALEGITIRVRQGVVTGLIGPDGAGKTTLMRITAGLLLPDKGDVHVLDIDVIKDPLLVQASIGYMPQRFGLYEDLTVQENLDLYADLQGVPKPRRAGRYTELIKMTGLEPFTRRLARKLSGGMKQKLGLACTLVRPPDFLLLDEPTVGVDPISRRELWAIVYRLVQEEGMSVLLSTAYLDEAERCQEVILMHEGHILGQDAPSRFRNDLKRQTFMLTSEIESGRRLQQRISPMSGVTDCIVLGDKVRLVTERSQSPEEIEGLFGDDAGLSAQAVPPRFEDAFISILKRRTIDRKPVLPAGEKFFQSPKGSRDEDVIVVEDLKRRFGNFYAVKGINFCVRRGEIFGLLGANGAGKSTTFRMLCGLLPASGGRLEVAGRNLRVAGAEARANIGYMAQKFSLYRGLTVLQNLHFFSSIYGLKGRRQKRRIEWAIESFELTDLLNVRSGDLSLGYKQRLALAVALIHEPEILFLDEPTSGVDPIARREFWHRINMLADANVTVLVTTHFMEEAEYCDRLVIMAQGEILGQGTPEDMKAPFRTPQNPEPSMEDAFIAMIEHYEDKSKSI
ncbi:MAG: ATP-binding cassette domain-containing protein [Nitrospiraceae bacterium]|nr:ATP-binding cassette domain-containing protein [Nitrospiraceae bacterium]